MFEKTFFVLSPSYHGATLLAKLINAHPDLTGLDNGSTLGDECLIARLGAQGDVLRRAVREQIERQFSAAKLVGKTASILEALMEQRVAKVRG